MKHAGINKFFRIIGIITVILSITGLLAFTSLKVFQSESTSFSFNDGPYIFYLNDSTIKTLEVRQNGDDFNILENTTDIRDTFEIKRQLKLYEDFNPSEKFTFSPTVEYSADKVAAISDIHGSFHHFKNLLYANQIIDDSLNWKWGKGHLVIVGDVFDKGPYVTECLWLIKKLEAQAAKQGGKVHYLLGNHEKLILSGDANYINLKYRNICKQLFVNYSQFFTSDTYWGRWLRSKSIVVKINNNLFAHGGISEQMVSKQYTLKEINKAFNTWINSPNLLTYDLKTRRIFSSVVNYFGPLEYRGYFNKNIFNRGQSSAFPDTTVDKVLKYYNVNHIVVGHTIVRKIKGLFGNKIIAVNNRFPEDDIIDTKSQCEMLIIEEGYYYQAGLDGTKTLLFSDKL
jgi:hypothetical protein